MIQIAIWPDSGNIHCARIKISCLPLWLFREYGAYGTSAIISPICTTHVVGGRLNTMQQIGMEGTPYKWYMENREGQTFLNFEHWGLIFLWAEALSHKVGNTGYLLYGMVPQDADKITAFANLIDASSRTLHRLKCFQKKNRGEKRPSP